MPCVQARGECHLPSKWPESAPGSKLLRLQYLRTVDAIHREEIASRGCVTFYANVADAFMEARTSLNCRKVNMVVPVIKSGDIGVGRKGGRHHQQPARWGPLAQLAAVLSAILRSALA